MQNNNLKDKLEKFSNDHLTRKRFAIQKREKTKIMIDSKSYINFCSSDYLNLSDEPKVKIAFQEGVNQYGLGSGASPLVSGYFEAQHALEEAFAEFIGREKAIYFNSGYMANIGTIPVLANRFSHIISDKLIHGSLIDGIFLSRAKHFRYQHNDMIHLKDFLEKSNQNSFVVTESVFSMEGDIPPLSQIILLAKIYHAKIILDDAHGIGVLGNQGKGICEHYSIHPKDIFCLISPLGKAFGSVGCMVSGEKEFIESILQFSRTYRYSTALPPAVAMATLKTLELIQKESWRREKLNHLIQYFIQVCRERNLPLISDALTPIKCFLIQDNKKTKNLQEKLLEKGFYVSCIRPPTVPLNTARIRISLNCYHEEKEIDQLLDAISENL